MRLGVHIKPKLEEDPLHMGLTVRSVKKLLDKTGTVTLGRPELEQLVPLDGVSAAEMLRLAASVDRLPAHPLARALVAGAEATGFAARAPA